MLDELIAEGLRIATYLSSSVRHARITPGQHAADLPRRPPQADTAFSPCMTISKQRLGQLTAQAGRVARIIE